MLNSVTGLRTEKKNKTTRTTVGLISKKTTSHVQHTFLSLPLLVHDYNVRLGSLCNYDDNDDDDDDGDDTFKKQ